MLKIEKNYGTKSFPFRNTRQTLTPSFLRENKPGWREQVFTKSLTEIKLTVSEQNFERKPSIFQVPDVL